MNTLTQTQQDIINQALTILASLFQATGEALTSPAKVSSFCQLQIAHLEHEVFGVMFLDNQHRLIAYKNLFRGTIDGASVYPREVAKEALALNAQALIFTHNHPSGIPEPSMSDKQITDRLVNAMGLLDIRVLDHIIVTTTSTVSFAERGLI